MKRILFATSNEHKFREAESVLKAYSIKIVHANVSFPEIRADECSTVARSTATTAFEQLREHVIVEDSGLFVEALNGFPGAYSAWAYKKIGSKGLLELLKNEGNRKAEFVSAIAFTDGKKTEIFEGRIEGEITQKERGKNGFAFDVVFAPVGSVKTFAEDTEYKQKKSHRRKSFEKFAEWYLNYLKKHEG
ncbi:XTP/dITP diphosphatase [Candidatus Micrarchaeota archaeon]|nr:XTP/dITP diphosphatase [Candidatus Micrarchaeota archaeon]